MARSTITPNNLTGIDSNGENLTDASFTTMGTGSGNGVEFTYDNKDIIVIKNDTGGPATVTLVLREPSSITDLGGSITDPTITIADGKTHFFRPTEIMKQSDGNVYIDCDVAAKIRVYNL